MLNVRRSLRGSSLTTEINMGPLIDMVFLLLIFFVVTTSFVKETGVDVERATASGAKEKGNNIMLAVTAGGDVYYDRQRIDVRSVRSHVARALAENPESDVVVIADKKSETGIVVQVVDQCRLAGAKHVALAAQRGEAPGG